MPFSSIVETSDVIVVRDSRLGRAVQVLVDSPNLIEAVANGHDKTNGHS